MSAAAVHRYVTRAFLDIFGDAPVLRQVRHPASDYTEELDSAKRSLDYFLSEIATKGPAVRESYLRQIENLERRITELSALPVREATVTYEPTGQTYRDVWENSSDPERRKLLLDGGFKVYTAPYSNTFTAEEFTAGWRGRAGCRRSGNGGPTLRSQWCWRYRPRLRRSSA